ncbi:MAG: hypothetical protein GXO24_01990 [Chlorobi bacterium]|jgi:hypothetical protein|nr:hypothetical protein [Chlorobiota bacterium]
MKTNNTDNNSKKLKFNKCLNESELLERIIDTYTGISLDNMLKLLTLFEHMKTINDDQIKKAFEILGLPWDESNPFLVDGVDIEEVLNNMSKEDIEEEMRRKKIPRIEDDDVYIINDFPKEYDDDENEEEDDNEEA